jgi:glycosyltransferase involved in cell wall biosynthesis
MLPASTPPLVLAGAQGWGDTDLTREIDKLGLRQRVHLPGRVPDGLLSALYSAADVFVYPSYYEGFGLPVLEAMTCGAPVITSNCSSLPEVAGDAAILVDPADAAALAAAMSLVINTPELRDRMRTLGIEQARKFSWQRAAQQTVGVYRQVVAGVYR